MIKLIGLALISMDLSFVDNGLVSILVLIFVI